MKERMEQFQRYIQVRTLASHDEKAQSVALIWTQTT